MFQLPAHHDLRNMAPDESLVRKRLERMGDGLVGVCSA